MSAAAETPAYFGAPGRPLFGWLDERARLDVGIVLCPPLGYEAVCCHRTLRSAAHLAGARGIATLRLDYDGTGDSAGADDDPGRMEAWLDSIDAGIELLRHASGVREICLWGFRMGASLAALCAQRRGDIDALIAVAPVAAGRQYLRQLRAVALAGGTGNATGDTQEAVGFVTTQQTRAALEAMNLGEQATHPARRILLLERSDLPADNRWQQSMLRAGASLQSRGFADYAGMMADPHMVRVPDALIAGAVDWLTMATTAQPTSKATATPHVASAATGTAAPLARGSMSTATYRERPLWLEGGHGVFAIATEPVAPIAACQVLVLLNSGGVNHIGPNRYYATLARELARAGVVTLRIDLPGIGDSPVGDTAEDNVVYAEGGIPASRALLASVARAYPGLPLHAGGICSGAYHALKCALEPGLLASAIVINPLTYFWKQGMVIEMPDFRVTAEAARYQRTMFSAAAWRKVFAGGVDLRNVARVVWRRAAARAGHALRDAARLLRLPLADDLGRELLVAEGHGTRLHFVFAATDPGLAMLRDQAGVTLRGLLARGAVTTTVIPDADHTFTALAARKLLTRALRGRLGLPAADANP